MSDQLVVYSAWPAINFHASTIATGIYGLLTVAGSAASSLFDQYPDQCIGTAVMAVGGIGARGAYRYLTKTRTKAVAAPAAAPTSLTATQNADTNEIDDGASAAAVAQKDDAVTLHAVGATAAPITPLLTVARDALSRNLTRNTRDTTPLRRYHTAPPAAPILGSKRKIRSNDPKIIKKKQKKKTKKKTKQTETAQEPCPGPVPSHHVQAKPAVVSLVADDNDKPKVIEKKNQRQTKAIHEATCAPVLAAPPPVIPPAVPVKSPVVSLLANDSDSGEDQDDLYQPAQTVVVRLSDDSSDDDIDIFNQ